MRDGTALLWAACDCITFAIRSLARVVLAGMNPQGEDLLKQLCGMEPQEDLVAILLLTGLHLEKSPSGL